VTLASGVLCLALAFLLGVLGERISTGMLEWLRLGVPGEERPDLPSPGTVEMPDLPSPGTVERPDLPSPGTAARRGVLSAEVETRLLS